MPVFDFLSTRELRQDLDRPLTAGLPPGKPPVFVLGLHRSGTTYLYHLIAASFPVGVCTLYHITHFRRLLHAAAEGLTETYRGDVRAELERRGLTDRGIDGSPVGPDVPEEYAFILRKFTRGWGFSRGGEAIFDEMLRKLSALQPEARALLLKNPLDLPNATAIKARYPDARFIFIRRDPARVLNSQFRNSFYYRRRPDPFLDILIAGVPLWRGLFRLMTALNKVIPDALYQRLLIAGLRRSIQGSLDAHARDKASLDPACYVEVSYEDLLADPEICLAEVERLLQLPRREGVLPAAAPRLEPLFPAVEAVAEAFRRQVARP
jgi:hypothetical protein